MEHHKPVLGVVISESSNGDFYSAPASPTGRDPRQLVATQAVEIERLHRLCKEKDKETHEVTRRYLEEVRKVEVAEERLKEREVELSKQLKALQIRLRDVENKKEAELHEEVQSMLTISQAAKERDHIIHELRDELRELRRSNGNMVQERELLLSKLVDERERSAILDIRIREISETVDLRRLRDDADDAASATGMAQHFSVLPKRLEIAFRQKYHSTKHTQGTQTEELGAISIVPVESDACTVDALRRIMSSEQDALLYHQKQCSIHAGNAEVLHKRIQQRIHYEMKRLQDEQDNYGKLLTSHTFAYPSTSLRGTGSIPASLPRHISPSSTPDDKYSGNPFGSTTPTPTRPAASSAPVGERDGMGSSYDEPVHGPTQLEKLQHRLEDLAFLHQRKSELQIQREEEALASGASLVQLQHTTGSYQSSVRGRPNPQSWRLLDSEAGSY